MKVLGIDFGTTSFGGCIFDARDGSAAFLSKPNTCRRAIGLRREFDIDQVRADLFGFIDLMDETFDLSEVKAVSVTGNMHSFLLARHGKPITDIITWQDERVLDEYLKGQSYVDFINETYGEYFSRYQPMVSSGYAVTTLLHLLDTEENLKGSGLTDCSLHFAPDFIVQELIGNETYAVDRALTDHSLAHSSGLYAIEHQGWNQGLINALGYGELNLPRIAEPGTFVGSIGEHVPALRGVPIFLGMGDNQASVFGVMTGSNGGVARATLQDPHALVLNMGTSGQVSAIVTGDKGPSRFFDHRPFLDGAVLLVGASLACGRAMEAVKDFLQDAAQVICGEVVDDELAYKTITQSILPESPLKFRTTLNGTRYSPEMRGAITNIDLSNLSLANLVTATAYGVVEELHEYYEAMEIDCTRIIGVGNALRKNLFFVEIVEQVFGKDVYVSEIDEAASYGAALCAMRGLSQEGRQDDGE
ncbi:MAG: hypothetical protein GX986_12535 [Firmicutes bacterium]|nr:hypothetical protein [Bacillota bacterium]